jgi:hypothetical protein
MFLKEKASNELVEVLGLRDLFDPFKGSVVGRYNAGEEMPDPKVFPKGGLGFLSGEELPRCWVDPDYRGHGHG